MEKIYYEVPLQNEEGMDYLFWCSKTDRILNLATQPSSFPPHISPDFELKYVLSGSLEAIVEGHHYHLQEGDLLVVHPREVHQYSAEIGQIYSAIVLKFDPAITYSYHRMMIKTKYCLPVILYQLSNKRVFGKEDLTNTLIPNLIKEIYEEYKEKNLGFELTIGSNVSKIHLFLLRHWIKEGLRFSKVESLNDDLVRSLYSVIEEMTVNYTEKTSPELAAQKCHMSYSQFNKLFKNFIGKTYVEYHNFIRIAEAEKLLLTTKMNITDIAMKVGFADTSYFIKVFKEYKNITPKQYQQHNLTYYDN